MNGFALGLGLKRKLRATRKWAILTDIKYWEKTPFYNYTITKLIRRYTGLHSNLSPIFVMQIFKNFNFVLWRKLYLPLVIMSLATPVLSAACTYQTSSEKRKVRSSSNRKWRQKMAIDEVTVFFFLKTVIRGF